MQAARLKQVNLEIDTNDEETKVAPSQASATAAVLNVSDSA